VLVIFGVAERLKSASCVGTELSEALRTPATVCDEVAVTDLIARIKDQPREVLDAIAPEGPRVGASNAGGSARATWHRSLPAASRLLEVCCGNGAATRLIMQHVSPARLVGIDPSPCSSTWRPRPSPSDPRASFAIGEAAATGQLDACFDLVIAHTVYSHLIDPEQALAETRRALRPDGQLVIFDGDFATLTVAQFDGDPLQGRNCACLPLGSAPRRLGLPVEEASTRRVTD
jgi:SAM-dependent methyltransferase